MVVWNGSRPSLGVGAASHAPRPPSRRRGGGARLYEIDNFGLSRRARRVEADGVDEERSQLLPWLKLGGRGVARGQRVPPHPLYLSVPVPARSYERRVFARASIVLADLAAAGIVAQIGIFAERRALKDGHPIAARLKAHQLS